MIGSAFARLKVLWRRGQFEWQRRNRRPVPGRFQPYPHTLPDRYPWLFDFAAAQLRDLAAPRLLSFGCSRGDEVFSLRRIIPAATIRGIDIDPANVAICRTKTGKDGADGLSFTTASDTHGEPDGHYDAIFCLAVLCHGDLTVHRAHRADPLLRFDAFEAVVTDFARCLKPGGLLFLHTTNFRFCDTAVSKSFEVILDAQPDQMAPDALFDRANRLMPGRQYYSVGFRKQGG
jgi:SAM-dependent methyltransferase